MPNPRIIFLAFTILLFPALNGCLTAAAKTGRNIKETAVITKRAKPREAILQRLLPLARNDKTFPAAYTNINNSLFTFSVVKIETSLIPGTIIGGHHDGWSKTRYTVYYAKGKIDNLTQQQYISILLKELIGQGYKICGSKASVFDKDNSCDLRFLIRGRIAETEYDTFSESAGNYSENKITAVWKVYDKKTRKAIYKAKTSGYARLNGITPETIDLSIKDSFHNLLNSKDFTAFITKYTKKDFLTRVLHY